MASQTVRIDADGHRALRELRRATGETSSTIIRRALEEYRRRRFFDALDRGAAEYRRGARARREESAERDLWDATLGDGLEDA